MTAQTETMTASERLVREITVATDAAIGIIAVRCAPTEVYRVCDEIFNIANSNQQDFFIHTNEGGWAEYSRIDPNDRHAKPFDPLEPKSNERATAETLKAFQKLQDDNTPNEAFFVMLDLYFTFELPVTQTCIRKQAQRAMSNGQRLFLIVPDWVNIPDGLAPLMHLITFGFPTRDELSQSLDDVLEAVSNDNTPAPRITDEERSMIISNGQGMTSHAFETAVSLAITTYGEVNRIETEDDEGNTISRGSMAGFGAQNIIDMLREYKTALLRKTNVLELQKPVDAENIGGLDLFKDWMNQRKATFTPEAKEFNITPSRGALVVGPPGTGKSLIAKAAGSILNLPVVRFDVGRVFGSYIGQSEQSMRGALALLDAMAPIVLMLDEIDKGFAGMIGGQSDSGTTARVFGTFLTWMQERDQINRPVFLIMTANRIEGLPPELLRKGRVDEIFSVNVPNEAERAEIIRIHARLRNQSVDKRDMPALVRITENLVGAEIEALIEDAMVISFADGDPGLTYDYLEKAKANLKPMHTTRQAEFAAMRAWAEKNARPASTVDKQTVGTVTKTDGNTRRRIVSRPIKPQRH